MDSSMPNIERGFLNAQSPNTNLLNARCPSASRLSASCLNAHCPSASRLNAKAINMTIYASKTVGFVLCMVFFT